MEIRFLKESDIAFKDWVHQSFIKIREIEEVILDSETSAEIKRDIEWAIDINNTWDNILICLNKEKIVGYCWFLKQRQVPYGGRSYGNESQPYIWVHSIYTDPQFSRKGVATMLYDKLEEIAKSQNIKKIRVDIFPKNVISEKFHYKMGYNKEVVIFSKEI